LKVLGLPIFYGIYCNTYCMITSYSLANCEADLASSSSLVTLLVLGFYRVTSYWLF